MWEVERLRFQGTVLAMHSRSAMAETRARLYDKKLRIFLLSQRQHTFSMNEPLQKSKGPRLSTIAKRRYRNLMQDKQGKEGGLRMQAWPARRSEATIRKRAAILGDQSVLTTYASDRNRTEVSVEVTSQVVAVNGTGEAQSQGLALSINGGFEVQGIAFNCHAVQYC